MPHLCLYGGPRLPFDLAGLRSLDRPLSRMGAAGKVWGL